MDNKLDLVRASISVPQYRDSAQVILPFYPCYTLESLKHFKFLEGKVPQQGKN